MRSHCKHLVYIDLLLRVPDGIRSSSGRTGGGEGCHVPLPGMLLQDQQDQQDQFLRIHLHRHQQNRIKAMRYRHQGIQGIAVRQMEGSINLQAVRVDALILFKDKSVVPYACFPIRTSSCLLLILASRVSANHRVFLPSAAFLGILLPICFQFAIYFVFLRMEEDTKS